MIFDFSVRELFQLVLLILVVPLQYYLASRQGFQVDRQTLHSIVENSRPWVDPSSWKDFVSEKISAAQEWTGINLGHQVNLEGESPAKEVLEYRSKKFDDYFGTSVTPRNVRPKGLHLRVGQVVRHKKYNYRGVVIGWDLMAKAPQIWFREKQRASRSWTDGPHFVILVDTRDRPTPQMVYIPQEEVEVITNAKIYHPLLENYFENFDGAQYLLRPWLRELYPLD